MERLNIIGICGSLRKGSYNRFVLQNIKEMFKDEINLEILDISKLPLYNEDINEKDANSVIELKDKIENSDGVIIATPEYNFSISGALKNALDWFSKGDIKPFNNRKVAIISASLGLLGGARVQYHLRQVLLCLNSDVIRGPEVFIGHASKKMDESGKFIDEGTINITKDLINNLITKIKE